MPYRIYSQQVKFLVAKAKNPHLFPELEIPISTAKTWIKNKYHLKSPFTPNSRGKSISRLQKVKHDRLLEEIRELKRMLNTQTQVYKEMGLDPAKKHVRNKESRIRIVKYLQENRGRLGVYATANAIGLSTSRYKRWRKEMYDQNKKISNIETYFQYHPRALTVNEFNTLVELYTNPSLFYFPLHALITYAKKNDLLHCSPATWTKYVRFYNLKRPRTLEYQKNNYPVGISREHPNQLWHIDVSEIKMRSSNRFFLQVIIDNYSRYVLGWQLIPRISGHSSSELLLKCIKQYGPPCEILSDAGKENLNQYVVSTLKEYGVNLMVSKLTTSFSNSRIEVLFRTLKSNYLKKVRFFSRKKLFSYLEIYFTDFNQKIPHSYLNCRTPEEAYFGMQNDFYNEELKQKSKEAVRARMESYWS